MGSTFENRQTKINDLGDDVLQIRISQLNLSVHARNVLFKAGKFTVADLVQMSEKDIKELKGLGKKSQDEIQEVIEKILCQKDSQEFIVSVQIPENNSNDRDKQSEISQLGLSNRAFHALSDAGIFTEKDLVQMTVGDIAKLRNVGDLTRAEIRETIKKLVKEKYSDFSKNSQSKIDSLDDEICRIKISQLGFSNRAYHALHRAEKFTVRDLIQMTSQDIADLPNVGIKTQVEIYKMIYDIQSQGADLDIIKNILAKSDFLNDECRKIEVSQLGFSTRTLNALLNADILMVGDLIKLSEQDLADLKNIGSQGLAEISEVIKGILSQGEKYLENKRIKDFESEEQQIEGKGFDYDTIDALINEFSMSSGIMAEWFGVSRQWVYDILEKRPKKRRQKWTGKDLTESEYSILLSIIQNKCFEFNNDKVQCLCFNNKCDNFIAIFIYADEIKCFFLNALPESLQTLIINSNMQRYTKKELSGGTEGRIVHVLKEPFFMPDDSEKFRANAASRNMSVDEYSKSFSGYPLVNKNRITDERIIDFFESSLVDGKVYLSTDEQNHWIRSVASRNGYSIKDFVEFYGYTYYAEGDELTTEGARTRHIEDLKNYVTDGNIVYLPTNTRTYRVLNTYANNKGLSLNEYIASLGFKRTFVDPQVEDYTSEEDMQSYGNDGHFEERVFAEYPLLGSKIIPKETLMKLNQNTKYYIDKSLNNPSVNIPLRAEMQITLSVINHAKNWDNEENSKFWNYITLQYGYRDSNGNVARILQNSIEDALKKNRRLFIETNSVGREFKSTVVIHALTPRKSWMALFDFLFDFYKNNLNWELVVGDPLIDVMVRTLKGRLSGVQTEETEIVFGTSQIYHFQEGIRKLITLRPKYTRDLFEKLLQQIDRLTNSEDTKIATYEEQLCEEWFKNKLISIANSRKESGKEGPLHREVVTDYTKISVKLVLYKESQVRVTLPDIRLKIEDFDQANLTIRYKERIVYQKPMRWYGNELGKTLSGVSVALPEFMQGDSFDIQIFIDCDGEEIYNSGTELSRKFMVFSGSREINVSSIRKGNYTLVVPADTLLEGENTSLTRIDPFNNGGVKAFFAELHDGYILSINGMPVIYDRDTGVDIRIIAPKEDAASPIFFNGDLEYHFVQENNHCAVITESPELLNRYAILINGVQIATETLIKRTDDQGEAFAIPISGEENLCRIQVLDLEKEKLIYERNFFIVSDISYEFNRDFYHSYSDYNDAEFTVQVDDFCKKVNFTKTTDEIQIPYKDGVIRARIPKIKTEETTGEWFNDYSPAWYIDDIPQNSLLKVSAPQGTELKFFVEGSDLQYDGNGLVDIGNVMQSLRNTGELSSADITMQVSYRQASQKYLLTRVFYREGFIKQPEFWTEQDKLYWDQGKAFIGRPGRVFTLILSNDQGTVLSFKMGESTEYVELPEGTEIGNYKYEISILSGGLFKKEKTVIAEGECIIGDKEALRFRNRYIVIDSITDEFNETSGYIMINPCYIDQIEYLGEEDTSEGYRPVYKGTLYSLRYDGKRLDFSSTDYVNKKGYHIMPVNPVRIVYIGETTLCITDSDGDGLYYYYYYDKDQDKRVYALTDHEYTRVTKGRYSTADLYSYHTERE